jgi:MFS family permease
MEDPKRCTIQLVGLQPGTAEEDLVAAITRLYRSKSSNEVRQLIGNLPAVLTDSATEEVARKVHGFLHTKGGILKVTRNAPPASPTIRPAEVRKPVAVRASAKKEESAVPPAPDGIERRAKPRVHPGIRVQPMGVGGILDRSFRLLRDNFRLFFLIVFVPQAVFLVLNTGGSLLLGGLNIRPTPGMGIGFGISAVVAFIVFLVLQFWAQGALIHAVSETYLGHSTSVRGSYGAVRKRLLRLLGTLILLGILVVLGPALAGVLAAIAVPILSSVGVDGFILGVIGALGGIGLIWLTIHLFLNWFLADKVIVLEDLAWMSALRRSKELMNSRTEQGYWKRPKNKAGLIVVTGFFIGIAINLLFQLPGVGLSFVLPGIITATVSGLLNIIASSLATVYTATALILFYYDIRLRKEGFDLKMMAQGLG